MKKILIAAVLSIVGIVTYSFAHSPGPEEKTENSDKVILMNTEMFVNKIFDYNKEKDWKYKGDKPAIIDFYADWCGPCRKVAPIMKELAKEYEGKIVIYKVNVDNEKELSEAFGISSIPLILMIPKDGKPTAIPGAVDKETYKKAVDELFFGISPKVK